MKRNQTNPFDLVIGTIELLAVTLIAFSRKNLGTRLMPSLFKSCIASAIILALYEAMSPPLPPVRFFRHFVCGLVVLYVYHQLWVWFRRRPDIHSFSIGHTRLPLPGNPRFVHRYIEPVFWLCIGIIVLPIAPLLGAWISTASVCLFIEEQLARVQGKKRLFDTIDGRIEATTLQTALRPRTRSTSSTRNAVVTTTTGRSSTAPQISEIKERIDPALRKLIESDKQNNPGDPT